MAAGYAVALEAAAAQAEGPSASSLWTQAAQVHHFLGQRTPAVTAARRAVAFAPDDFNQHKLLASLLLAGEEYSEALRELKWCVSRAPNDASLPPLLQLASREQLKPAHRVRR